MATPTSFERVYSNVLHSLQHVGRFVHVKHVAREVEYFNSGTASHMFIVRS